MSSVKKSRKKAAVRRREPAPRRVAAKDATTLRRELDVYREELSAQNEELRLANSALLAVKDRYATLFEVAPIAYVTLDEKHRIVQANAMAGELLGVARPMLFGRTFDEFFAVSERNAFRAARRASARGGHAREPRQHARDTRRRRRGVPCTSRPRPCAPGRPSAPPHVLLCLADDRARRRREDARSMLDARTAEAHRLESLRRLAIGIAHDFARVVAIIETCSELGLRDLTADSPARSAVLGMREAGRRAAELTRQIGAFGGQELAVREDLDLSLVVASVEGLLRESIGGDVALKLDLAPDLPFFPGDVVQLRQTVVELVSNAAQALNGRAGSVVVRTRAWRTDVELVVEDDGPGMSPDVVPRIFDPFFSTRPGGRGLGLAIVQGHARAHGGTVSVTTEIGGGAVFRVSLPLHSPAARVSS